ncbi:hypothetical protein [Pedobacter sp. B4-66]|uniref:hypothetical protein n=1 Tax=Pedobacter sp. B4-66 TaxID=2817280 RepID=UPI001BD9C278|nr:hypothetical protein [Pedobacter sp. B4-66]
MSAITRKTKIDASLFYDTKDNNKQLIQLLEHHINKTGELEKLILDYEYGKGKIDNIEILKDTLVSNENLIGKFKAGYHISEYSICAAIDYTDVHSMDIDFAIDKDTNELILTGETRYERFDEI